MRTPDTIQKPVSATPERRIYFLTKNELHSAMMMWLGSQGVAMPPSARVHVEDRARHYDKWGNESNRSGVSVVFEYPDGE